MPRIGRPAAWRSRRTASTPRSLRPVHRRARRADARQDREVGARDVVDELGAEARERELDRAHVARRRSGRSRPSQDPLGRRESGALGAKRGAQRAADRLERRLGDVMRIRPVASTWMHMRPLSARLCEHVLREARVELQVEHGGAASAEIDCRARERVVHRHDRVAVARDPTAVAERAVERLAERDRRVLGRVVRRRSRGRRCLRGSGRARRGTQAARGSGRRAPRRSRRARDSRRRVRAARGAASRRSRGGGARGGPAARPRPANAASSRSSSSRSCTVTRSRSRRRARRSLARAAGRRARAARRPERRGSCRTTAAARSRACGARRRAARAPRSSGRVGRRRERGERERRGERRHRRRRLPRVELGGGLGDASA